MKRRMAPGNVAVAVAFLEAVADGDVETVTGLVSSAGFIQHDPSVADGVAGLRNQVDRRMGMRRPEVVRTLEDGPLVVVHGRDATGEIFFAVLRVEDGMLAEHWRFEAPSAPPNVSGHTQTDGPLGPDLREDAVRAKALVTNYYETVHIGGRQDKIGDYMSGNRQIRHEPGVRDGVTAFEADLAMLTKNRSIDEIVLLAGQGDLVFIAARGTHEGAPCAYIDLYRVEADQLVEHWGFPQAILPPQASRNDNGLL